MAKDDGSVVKIDETHVFKKGDPPNEQFDQWVKVCNRTNQPKDVWVVTWPWYKLNEKKKPENMMGHRVRLAANECKWILFVHTKKIEQYYTDAYPFDPTSDATTEDQGNNECSRYHYDVGTPPAKIPPYPPEGFPPPPKKIIKTVYCPYPRSLEESNQPLDFYIHKIRNLPKYWKLVNIWPKIGQTFKLYPDQKEYPITFEIKAIDIKKDEAFPIKIQIAVSGHSHKPPYYFPITINFARKTKPPKITKLTSYVNPKRPWLRFLIQVKDTMGMLDVPVIHYSKNEGKTWENTYMNLQQIIDNKKLGISEALFSVQIPLRNEKSKILAYISITDLFDNKFNTGISEYPKVSNTKRVLKIDN